MPNIVWDKESREDVLAVVRYLRERTPGRGRVSASEAVRWSLRRAVRWIEWARERRRTRRLPGPKQEGANGLL